VRNSLPVPRGVGVGVVLWINRCEKIVAAAKKKTKIIKNYEKTLDTDDDDDL
jgi:hypothetical protein